MKKLLNKRYFLIGGGIILLMVLSVCVYLISTDDYTDAKFRSMQDDIPSLEQVDLTGLRELEASGGPSIDFPDLKKRLSHIKKNIIIVDGIGQFHGYFEDLPSSFFGYSLDDADLRHFIRRFIFTGTFEERPELITSESEEAQKKWVWV